jgi:hypothetical protein
MYKKTVTYVDFDGNERTEDLYFNLMKSEILEMELGVSGGLSGLIQRIIQAHDVPSIVAEVKKFILAAYGKKSPDGKRFVKSKEFTDEFTQTEAYSQLFTELVTNADSVADFINNVVPEDVAKQMAEQKKQADTK